MTKESLAKDIKVLEDLKKLTGSIGIYRRIANFKAVCNKYKQYPEIDKVGKEIADVDVLNGKGVEKVGKLDEYQEIIVKTLKLASDFEESKKTLKACKNSCKKYFNETPESALTNTGVNKNFKHQKALFQDRLDKCDKLQEKLDAGEIGMAKFCAEVNNIKRAIIGTVKELKSYGVLKTEKKSSIALEEVIFNY